MIEKETKGTRAKKANAAPKNAGPSWKCLLACCQVFKEIWIAQRLHTTNHAMYRAHGGCTKIDYLIGFQQVLKKTYPKARDRAKFWAWFWSPEIEVEGKAYRKNTEFWAQRFGSALLDNAMLPREFFRCIIRTEPNDKSGTILDAPRLNDIRKRYEKLRRDWQTNHAQELALAAQADIVEAIGTETPEETYTEPAYTEQEPEQEQEISAVEPDCVALDNQPEFANQHEGLDYEGVQ